MSVERLLTYTVKEPLSIEFERIQENDRTTILIFRINSKLPWMSKRGQSLQSLNEPILELVLDLAMQITELSRDAFVQVENELPSPLIKIKVEQLLDKELVTGKWQELSEAVAVA